MRRLRLILVWTAVGLGGSGCSTVSGPTNTNGPPVDGASDSLPTPAEAKAAHDDALAKLVDVGVVIFGPPPGKVPEEDAQKVVRVDFGPDSRADDEHLALVKKLRWYEGQKLDRSIHIHSSRVTDRGLNHLADFKLLNGELNLSGSNKITDEGMKHLSGLQLNTLVLANTRITNSGLANLRGLTVNGLLLEGTRVTEAGLGHLKGIQGLVQVQLDENQISVAGVKRVEKLLSDCKVVRRAAK